MSKKKVMLFNKPSGLPEDIRNFMDRVTDDGGTIEDITCIESIDADQVCYPVAYGDSKLYSQAREVLPTLGVEKVINGDFSNGSTGWTLNASTFSVSDEVLKMADGTGSAVCDAVIEVGKTYKLQIEKTSQTSGSMRWLMGSSTYNTFPTAIGVREFIVTATNTNKLTMIRLGAPSTMEFDNISIKEILYPTYPNSIDDFEVINNDANSTRTNKDGNIEVVPADYPVLDYKGSECPAVRIQDESHNWLQKSIAFEDVYWTKFRATVPKDGTTILGIEANKFIPDNGQVICDLKRTSTPATGGRSVYVKKAEARYFVFATSNGGAVTGRCVFDMLVGSWTRIAANHTVGFEVVDGEVDTYRLWIGFGNGENDFYLGLSATFDGARSYLGNGVDGVYIMGAQLEPANLTGKPSSLIITDTIGLTRNYTEILNSGNATSLDSENFVIYARIKANRQNGGDRLFGTRSDTGADGVLIGFTNSGFLKVFTIKGGVQGVVDIATTVDNLVYHRVAVKGKPFAWEFWVDGVLIGTDLTEDTYAPDTMTSSFLAITGLLIDFDGYVSEYKTKKGSDWDMKELTTTGVFRAPLYNTKIYGVSAEVPDAANLAGRLSILEANITYFNIDGADIEVFIDTPYDILASGFTTTAITNYEDPYGLLREIGSKAFKTCNSLASFDFRSVTVINKEVFYTTPLLVGVFTMPELLEIKEENSFRDSGITGLIANKLIDLGVAGFNVFRGATMTIFEAQSLIRIGTNVGHTGVLSFVDWSGVTMTIPVALETVNGGGPDGDLTEVTDDGGTIIYI